MAEALSWDAWKIAPPSSASSPSDGLVLNVQGTPLHDILALVRTEVDRLRRGDPKAAIAALANRFDDEKDKHKQDMTRLNEKVDRLSKKLMEGGSNDGMDEKLSQALQRIKDLEEAVHTKVPVPVQPLLAALQARVKELEDKVVELEESNAAASKGPEMPSDMVERLVSVERKGEALTDRTSNLTDRVRQLEDSSFALSNQQGKIIGDIAKLATSNEATQRNLDNVENMTDRHTEDIKDLFASKADLSALGGGGGTALVGAGGGGTSSFGAGGAGAERPGSARRMSRGNSNSHGGDEKLADLVHELDRQVKLLSVATTEGLNGVQKKTDKKIEFMTNWIIKYLKNLLSNGGGFDSGDKETDIGKVQMAVKCLVCNKPAKQNDHDAATPHPNFRTTFGVKKERKIKTDASGNRQDTGMRGAYNETEDWRVQRSESPPRADSPPSAERPKSAGPSKPPHVRAMQLADGYEHGADDDKMQRSATFNGEEAADKNPFYNAMEKKYTNRPISAPYRRPGN
jgi:predicted  nucleic acid-binding Zn-ribbon protein